MLSVALEAQAEAHSLHVPGGAVREADQLEKPREITRWLE